jgi:ATP-dependent Clp protease ATP-binding subunit ClpA
MFERFVAQSREAVKLAQDEARGLHHPYIGTEHLLLALAAQPDGPAADALHEAGIQAEALRQRIAALVGSATDDLDPEALATLGIDLDAVREATEATFGPGALHRPKGTKKPPTGHLRFTARSKKALELSLREALRLKHNQIGTGHILLGLIREGEGLAAQIITMYGVDLQDLRGDVVRRLTAEAA